MVARTVRSGRFSKTFANGRRRRPASLAASTHQLQLASSPDRHHPTSPPAVAPLRPRRDATEGSRTGKGSGRIRESVGPDNHTAGHDEALESSVDDQGRQQPGQPVHELRRGRGLEGNAGPGGRLAALPRGRRGPRRHVGRRGGLECPPARRRLVRQQARRRGETAQFANASQGGGRGGKRGQRRGRCRSGVGWSGGGRGEGQQGASRERQRR